MKTIKYILTLAAVCMLAMSVQAITLVEGDELFIKADQNNDDGGSWVPTGSQKIYLYIWNGSGEKWIPFEKDNGTIYRASLPAGAFADQFIIVRTSGSAAWSGKDRQTANLSWEGFPAKNCLTIFKTQDKNDPMWKSWGFYSPKATSILSVDKIKGHKDKDGNKVVKEEAVSICPNALGGPYSLRVKLSADKKSYDYGNVTCHAWYRSSDGKNWQAVEDFTGALRDEEKDQDIIKNNLPATIAETGYYYYLYSSTAAGRRLIKLTPNATGCDLDCKITFFGVACSDVNANDTTYTLDGMVAFGVPCGDLVITCDGKSTTIKEADAKSPQIFSIEGLRAATKDGKTTTATAKFTGNAGGKVTATVNIPNATQGIVNKHIDVLVGETATLDPAGANYTNKHVWYIDGKQTDKQGKQTSKAFNEPNVTRYMYREFNPPAGDMNDMMSNGGYETNDESFYGTLGSKSTISDYNFWGIYSNTGSEAIDFYTNTTINPQKWADNGFAVVKNANNFFYTFAKVTPREGQYFAMFDAAKDDKAGKKAWYATTAKNPNLKLKKGTTYLFSFWAANINNYGEMDNAAKLQFQIEYNGKTPEKLGKELDFGSAEFRNNRWHQCSATYTATEDADNVTISVINLNPSSLNTGNDFALDDIQFRAVSSATRSVRIQQVFEVQTHEPHVFTLAATAQPMDCDQTDYTVSLTVTYDNPKGKLVIKDMTTDHVLFNEAVPAVGADWDKKKTKTIAVKVEGLEPVEHRYKAYFDEWDKSFAEATSNAPQFSSCCVEGVLYSKWENVLFVSNAGNIYTAYQWYKNDQKLQGETKQRYYTGSTPMAGTSDTYFCEVTRRDGTVERTCAHTFDECPRSADHTAVDAIGSDGFAVYPTQAAAGTAVTVSKTYPGIVRADLLAITGQVVRSVTLSADATTIVMPETAGLYLLQLQATTTQTTIKINVY